jgi:hypothetical protein
MFLYVLAKTGSLRLFGLNLSRVHVERTPWRYGMCARCNTYVVRFMYCILMRFGLILTKFVLIHTKFALIHTKFALIHTKFALIHTKFALILTKFVLILTKFVLILANFVQNPFSR